jgi:hypothetical protein
MPSGGKGDLNKGAKPFPHIIHLISPDVWEPDEPLRRELRRIARKLDEERRRFRTEAAERLTKLLVNTTLLFEQDPKKASDLEAMRDLAKWANRMCSEYTCALRIPDGSGHNVGHLIVMATPDRTPTFAFQCRSSPSSAPFQRRVKRSERLSQLIQVVPLFDMDLLSILFRDHISDLKEPEE